MMKLVRCEKSCECRRVCQKCPHKFRHLAGDHAACLTAEHECGLTPKRKCVPLRPEELSSSEKLPCVSGYYVFDAGR